MVHQLTKRWYTFITEKQWIQYYTKSFAITYSSLWLQIIHRSQAVFDIVFRVSKGENIPRLPFVTFPSIRQSPHQRNMACLLAQPKGRAHWHTCMTAVQTPEALSVHHSKTAFVKEQLMGSTVGVSPGKGNLLRKSYSHDNSAVDIFHLFLYFLIILTYLILYMRILILYWIIFLK